MHESSKQKTTKIPIPAAISIISSSSPYSSAEQFDYRRISAQKFLEFNHFRGEALPRVWPPGPVAVSKPDARPLARQCTSGRHGPRSTAKAATVYHRSPRRRSTIYDLVALSARRRRSVDTAGATRRRSGLVLSSWIVSFPRRRPIRSARSGPGLRRPPVDQQRPIRPVAEGKLLDRPGMAVRRDRPGAPDPAAVGGQQQKRILRQRKQRQAAPRPYRRPETRYGQPPRTRSCESSTSGRHPDSQPGPDIRLPTPNGCFRPLQGSRPVPLPPTVPGKSGRDLPPCRSGRPIGYRHPCSETAAPSACRYFESSHGRDTTRRGRHANRRGRLLLREDGQHQEQSCEHSRSSQFHRL